MAMAEVVSVCVCVYVGFFALDGSDWRAVCVCARDARWPSVSFERSCF